jgi:hypothetical protein
MMEKKGLNNNNNIALLSELIPFKGSNSKRLCCNFILPLEGQAALLSEIYSQGTDRKENTFSVRSPTKHALLYRV